MHPFVRSKNKHRVTITINVVMALNFQTLIVKSSS